MPGWQDDKHDIVESLDFVTYTNQQGRRLGINIL